MVAGFVSIGVGASCHVRLLALPKQPFCNKLQIQIGNRQIKDFRPRLRFGLS